MSRRQTEDQSVSSAGSTRLSNFRQSHLSTSNSTPLQAKLLEARQM